MAARAGAVTFPASAILLYLTPALVVGRAFFAISVLCLLVVLVAVHVRARKYYGRTGSVLFTAVLLGLVFSLNPWTAVGGGLILLVAMPWFLVRLVRRTPFMGRNDLAPLIAGLLASLLIAYVFSIVGRDAEPAFIALCAGIGGTLYRMGRALDPSPSVLPA